MNKAELYSLCVLLMCSDPWPEIDKIDRLVLEALANRVSGQFGYSHWIEAYHEIEF